MADYGFDINVGGDILLQLAKINESIAGMGNKAVMETEKAEGAFSTFGTKITETFGGLKSMLLGGLGISALFEGFEFIKSSKEAFDNLEKSVVQVEASLKSTKGTAGMTFEDVNNSAKELSKNTLFGRSSILDMQSVLLTFPSITKEVFPSASQAILDMATKLKSGPTEAAIQLGKALQDPEKGISALHRVGVNTDELKKKFETVTDTLSRQKLIIAELNTEFGGSAKAATTTDEGKIEMAKKSWGSIKLTIGEIISKLEVSFVPVLLGITTALKSMIAFFESTSASATLLKDAILAIAAALAVYYTYLGLVAAWTNIVAVATWAWDAAMSANPISWLIMAIVALVAALAYCWDNFKGFREFMGGMWGGIVEYVKIVIQSYITLGNVIGDIFHGNFKKAIEDGKKGLADLADGFTHGMVDAVKKGADAAGKSEFKVSSLLSFGLGGKKEGGEGKDGANATNQNAQAAMNTSALSGASGGLGQAKVINITFKDAFQKITTTDNKQLPEKGQDAVEQMIRAINNIAYNEGQTQ